MSLMVYRALFEVFDKNSDGELSVGELQSALQQMGVELSMLNTIQLLGTVDADGSGTLNYDEFSQLLSTRERPKAREAALRMFRLFDLDGDGFLSRDELTTLFQWLGIDAEDDVRDWVESLDQNGDGVVDFEEFVAGIALDEDSTEG